MVAEKLPVTPETENAPLATPPPVSEAFSRNRITSALETDAVVTNVPDPFTSNVALVAVASAVVIAPARATPADVVTEPGCTWVCATKVIALGATTAAVVTVYVLDTVPLTVTVKLA